MTPEELRQLISIALTGGCGVLISMVYQLWVDNIDNNPSAFASRAAVAVLCVIVPGGLYLLGVVAGWWDFQAVVLFADIAFAFMTSQGWHGATQLTGSKPTVVVVPSVQPPATPIA